MAYRIAFYRDERGQEPVRDFIDALSSKTQQKILAWINKLQEEGPFLRRPYADKVKDKLYELRIRFSSDSIRILYFFYLRDKIVLLHGFRKKDWKIHRSDMELAERRMDRFIRQYEEGKFKF